MSTAKKIIDPYVNPNRGRDVAVNIAFDTSKFTSEDMQKLFHVEELLRELGISSDTGAAFNDDGTQRRDWQWDWSLRGPVKVEFVNFTDDDPKNRYVRAAEKNTQLSESVESKAGGETN